MDDLSSILAAEPVVEVIGQTHIKVLGSKVTLQDVNVGEQLMVGVCCIHLSDWLAES